MANQDNFLENGNIEVTCVVDEQKIISLKKFIILSIISFGLYGVWWIYKAWKFYQQKEKPNINPALYTIFSIFFLISLFKKVLGFAKAKGYKYSYPTILLFVGFVGTNLLVKLPDPFWLIAILSFVFLIPPFQAFNFAKRNSSEFIVIEQTSYSGRQIAIIVIGAIFWILVLFGMIVTNDIL